MLDYQDQDGVDYQDVDQMKRNKSCCFYFGREIMTFDICQLKQSSDKEEFSFKILIGAMTELQPPQYCSNMFLFFCSE